MFPHNTIELLHSHRLDEELDRKDAEAAENLQQCQKRYANRPLSSLTGGKTCFSAAQLLIELQAQRTMDAAKAAEICSLNDYPCRLS